MSGTTTEAAICPACGGTGGMQGLVDLIADRFGERHGGWQAWPCEICDKTGRVPITWTDERRRARQFRDRRLSRTVSLSELQRKTGVRMTDISKWEVYGVPLPGNGMTRLQEVYPWLLAA